MKCMYIINVGYSLLKNKKMFARSRKEDVKLPNYLFLFR
jgi:hypothetical protein